VIKFRLEAREEEVALIREAARKSGLSANEFMREVLFGDSHTSRRKPSQSATPTSRPKNKGSNRPHERCAS
jgi:hypothetical protein